MSSLLIKRASSSELCSNSEPAARRPPSVGRKTKTYVDRTSDLLAAWGAGRFNASAAYNASANSAYTEFFAADVVVDSSAAAHVGVAEFKTYNGHDGAKAWFDFLGTLEFEGLEMTHVAGPTPNEVWLRFTAANQVSKKTGKGASYSHMTIFTWEGDKVTKIVNVPFHPARSAAILSEEDVPVPPMAALPSFEPHPEPMTAYQTLMALWGSGELYEPDVYKKYVATDALNDVTDSALPSVLKAYEGSDNVREWMEHVNSNWELSNMAVEPVAGLAPGCVTHRFTVDVRHRVTGKEAKGVQCFVELAYNTDGQFVYGRNYWLNAAKLASIYALDEFSDI